MNVPGFISLAEAVSMIVVERTAEAAVAERTAQVAARALKSRIKVLGGPYSVNSGSQRRAAWFELRTSLFAGLIKSYLANWHEIIAQIPEDTWHEYYPFPIKGEGSWLRVLTEHGAVAGSVVVRIPDVHKLTHEKFSYSSRSIRLGNSLAADGENHDDASHIADPVTSAAAFLGPYVSPYLAFMIRASNELGLTDDKRVKKEVIQSWIAENWPEELGECTVSKARSMATFLRHPKFEVGGNSPNNAD